MIFEQGSLYHIYNQGNNRRKIYYSRRNYLFFLKKIKEYILPFSDVLAWCLMPNHFHLMVMINEIEIESQGFTPSETLTYVSSKQSFDNRTFNQSIGILLRTYTRAINKQEGITGLLFRKETKAECLNCFKSPKLNFSLNDHLSEKQYPQICFNYIHENPVKANLTKRAIDCEFSSARDYKGFRNSILINKEISKEYVEF